MLGLKSSLRQELRKPRDLPVVIAYWGMRLRDLTQPNKNERPEAAEHKRQREGGTVTVPRVALAGCQKPSQITPIRKRRNRIHQLKAEAPHSLHLSALRLSLPPPSRQHRVTAEAGRGIGHSKHAAAGPLLL